MSAVMDNFPNDYTAVWGGKSDTDIIGGMKPLI